MKTFITERSFFFRGVRTITHMLTIYICTTIYAHVSVIVDESP